MNSEYNPHALPLHSLPKESEDLFLSAIACLKIRDELDLPHAESVGQLFLECCSESSSTNPQRRGPRRLATALIAKLAQHAA